MGDVMNDVLWIMEGNDFDIRVYVLRLDEIHSIDRMG